MPTAGTLGTTVSDGTLTWTRVNWSPFMWKPWDPAIIISGPGTYPTGFVGGETLTIGRDGEADVVVTFQAGDTTKATVISRIIAAFPVPVGREKFIADHNGEAATGIIRLRSKAYGTAGQIRVVVGSAGVLTMLGLSVTTVNGIDGPVFWTRFHGGVHFDVTCDIENVCITGADNDCFHVVASGSGPGAQNANFFQLLRVSATQFKGGFIHIRGTDANNGLILGARAYNSGGIHERNYSFRDGSLAGCVWIGCDTDAVYGYSFEQSSSTSGGMVVLGGHAEGGQIKMHSGTILGVQPAIFTRSSNVVDPTRGGNIYAQNTIKNVEVDNSNPAIKADLNLYGYLGGRRVGVNSRLITLGVQASRTDGLGYEITQQGFTLSNLIKAPHVSSPFVSFVNGWHVWTNDPWTYGVSFTPFAISGDQSPAWKDQIGTGHFWLTRGGCYVGALLDGTIPWAWFWRAAAPTTGSWREGDQIVNTDFSPNDVAGWRCVTAGTPGTWKAFGRILGAVEKTAAAIAVWRDDAFTDAAATAPKTLVRSRRRDAETTTATANQVIDDGGSYGGEDFTLPDNAITRLTFLIVLKKNATADGGTIEVKADYARNGGAPTIIGTATTTYNLAGATLNVTTVNLVVNGNKVELQASPESADTLHWRIVRTQTEGLD